MSQVARHVEALRAGSHESNKFDFHALRQGFSPTDYAWARSVLKDVEGLKIE